MGAARRSGGALGYDNTATGNNWRTWTGGAWLTTDSFAGLCLVKSSDWGAGPAVIRGVAGLQDSAPKGWGFNIDASGNLRFFTYDAAPPTITDAGTFVYSNGLWTALGFSFDPSGGAGTSKLWVYRLGTDASPQEVTGALTQHFASTPTSGYVGMEGSQSARGLKAVWQRAAIWKNGSPTKAQWQAVADGKSRPDQFGSLYRWWEFDGAAAPRNHGSAADALSSVAGNLADGCHNVDNRFLHAGTGGG